MTSGILLIDKPAGVTSFDVVRRARQALQVKKIGHLGTLDPFATGLLPLCLGEATKLVPFLLPEPKTYRAEVYLGVFDHHPGFDRGGGGPGRGSAVARGNSPGRRRLCGGTGADSPHVFGPPLSRAASLSPGAARAGRSSCRPGRCTSITWWWI